MRATSEILVSITSLEFAYTQAPARLKSVVMSLYLTGPSYYLFFAATMLGTAVLFVPFAMRFREERHIHEEAAA